LLMVGLALLLSSIVSFVRKNEDWRQRLGFAAAKD
jgi:hypothetical protein